jgi:hypothetical protein
MSIGLVVVAIGAGLALGIVGLILDYRAHGEGLVAALPNATLHLIDGGHMLPITAR